MAYLQKLIETDLTITTDDAAVVADVNGNFNVSGLGETSTQSSGNPNVQILSPRTAKWIVDPTLNYGTHQTIASAIASASSGETIFVRPGSYTENLTLKAGVNLVAFSGDEDVPNVIIGGKCTFSSAGTVDIANIRLETNGDYCLSVTGTSASIVNLNNCYIDCTDFTGIEFTSTDANSLIFMDNCNTDVTTTLIALFASTSAGTIRITDCECLNSGSSVTPSTMSAGSLEFQLSRSQHPFSISGTCILAMQSATVRTDTINTTSVAIDSTGDSFIRNSSLRSGTATCLTVAVGKQIKAHLCDFESTNAAAISGAGTIAYSICTFSQTSSNNTVSTQTIRSFGPNATCGSSASGATNTFMVENSSNTASSNAIINCQVGGTSANDPTYKSTVSGGQSWAFGLDNSASDAFVLSAGGTLGSTDVVVAQTTGEINFPLQSGFSARRSATQNNVTGDGTAWTIISNSESFDQNGDYVHTTGIYTAPITGRVLFCGICQMSTYSDPAEIVVLQVVTSNRTIRLTNCNVAISDSTQLGTFNGSFITDMDAGDTASLVITISGGTKSNENVGATEVVTGFSGWMLG